jgi:hypothetical protein
MTGTPVTVLTECPPRRMRVGLNYMWAYNKYGLYFGPH